MKKELPRVAAEGAIRLLQISFLPVLVFALFQWTLRDNWLSTFISVIAFLAVLGSFGWLIAQVVNLEFISSKVSPVLSRLIRPKNNRSENGITQEGHESTNEEPKDERSTEPKSSSPKKWWSSIAFSRPIKTAAVSAFVAPYRPTRQTFSLLSPFLLTTLKAAFIALAKTHGFTQVLALIIIEFLYLIAIIIAKPFYPRYRDEPKTTLDSPGTGHSPITPSPVMDSPECKSPDSKTFMGKTDSPQEKDIEDSNPHPKRRKANIFSRRGDFLELFLSVLRIISTAGLLPFVREKLAVDAIPRVAVGIGIAVVCSVGVLVLVANIVVHILPWKSFWRGSREKKDRSTGQEVHQTTSPTNESL
ncbi:hypothetical protein FRC19_006630 [Serendipita sp. 401]|nr:hypothetical protein FRC18_007237 [Serendipita sp. 400]KAG8807518.1 hypothetical protein FRC19_006630 [Serendipita sp. 401]